MLGDKIKEARKAKKLTQRQLAGMIGVKNNTLCGWENNSHSPNSIQIRQICEALEIEPNFLYSKEEINLLSTLSADDFLTAGGKELPEEAKREIDNFIEYIKMKYKK
jgi:transcriptional regulator with XRE-family HTH domain